MYKSYFGDIFQVDSKNLEEFFDFLKKYKYTRVFIYTNDDDSLIFLSEEELSDFEISNIFLEYVLYSEELKKKTQ